MRGRKVSGGWFDIDWAFVNRKVYQMQVEIRVAWKNKDKAKVAMLQMNLVNSWAGRALAVRTVVTNKGKKTPGVDGEVWETPDLKFAAIEK
jgi:RNA-directed DNA polymerase